MKKMFKVLFLFALVFAFLAVPMASLTAMPQPITAPNYPTQSIIQGDLTLHMDDTNFAQKLVTLDKKIEAVGHWEVFLALLVFIVVIGIIVMLALLIVRTKTLKALGLSQVAEDPKDGAAEASPSGAQAATASKPQGP